MNFVNERTALLSQQTPNAKVWKQREMHTLRGVVSVESTGEDYPSKRRDSGYASDEALEAAPKTLPPEPPKRKKSTKDGRSLRRKSYTRGGKRGGRASGERRCDGMAAADVCKEFARNRQTDQV
ncbi:uncharacterized protein LTR77_008933 [Saxophila tyrrhenica]|uniref:Uncharacterized protein n=1 Tax=Saxophila tyrrhenica TaxID=1690608 RepID=A0AAV9P2V7_9PEZI|nr:hypothetical protein LTR77_008933 [Saxophila tyrrhenica]